jgi:hypothetical protein
VGLSAPGENHIDVGVIAQLEDISSGKASYHRLGETISPRRAFSATALTGIEEMDPVLGELELLKDHSTNTARIGWPWWQYDGRRGAWRIRRNRSGTCPKETSCSLELGQACQAERACEASSCCWNPCKCFKLACGGRSYGRTSREE